MTVLTTEPPRTHNERSEGDACQREDTVTRPQLEAPGPFVAEWQFDPDDPLSTGAVEPGGKSYTVTIPANGHKRAYRTKG